MKAQRSWPAAWISLIALLVAILVPSGARAVPPPRDRTPPTTPTNLRVTGVSDYSVTLSWNPSTDDSGVFSYRLFSSAGTSALVPQYSTSYTFATNHTAGSAYSFYVYAQDGSNNRSGNSNTVSATLLPAGTPPSAPVLSVTHVGPRHITVSWTTPSDAGPTVHFFLNVDGQAVLTASQETSYTLYFVQPQTSHTFTVQARDGHVRYSPLSTPVSVKTPPADAGDVKSPTAPTGLWAGSFGDGSTEFYASWARSTDDLTAQAYITYLVYLNGEFLVATAGSDTTIDEYADDFGPSTLEVIAMDEAGNESEPETLVFSLP